MLRVCRALSLARCSSKSACFSSGDVAIVEGISHPNFKNRRVTIYAPARSAGQQGMSRTVEGQGKGPVWKIEWDAIEKWQNQLMGWTSTADPVECVGRSTLTFNSKGDAIAFCNKHGWEYEVQEPNMRRLDRQKRFAGYGDNFSVKRGGYPVGGLPSERQETKK